MSQSSQTLFSIRWMKSFASFFFVKVYESLIFAHLFISKHTLYCKPVQGFWWVCSWYTEETHHDVVIHCSLAGLDHVNERGKDQLCL